MIKELDARQQLMVITMEECAELQQVCSKILRRGTLDDEYKEKLVQEIGDVYCMIGLIQQYDFISWSEIENASAEKQKKLEKWSDLC